MSISPTVDATNGDDARWRSGMVSSSLVMDELFRQAHRAATVGDPVLISGSRGSGKKSLARAIHAASPRARNPFIVIPCSELADMHAEPSALVSALACARGGFLLLDEVEELPLMEQARLLPLVRQQVPFSAPSSKVASDVSIVATTTQPLDQAIRDGRFRADLFYALGRSMLNLPALSERQEDIPVLVAHFVTQAPAKARGFSPEAMTALQDAAWPGNVQQLRSVVEQALALSVTSQVPVTVVRRLLREENEREMAALDEARRAFEYDYLVNLLETTGGNVTRAARVAKRNRTEFYKLLARHKLDPANYK